MDGPAFFARLATALKDNRLDPVNESASKGLARIGLRPGEDLDIETMDVSVAKGLTRAARRPGRCSTPPPTP